MRLLIDTNIILDLIYTRKESSKDVFRVAKNKLDEIYICSYTLKDIAYFLKKTIHDNNKVNNALIKIYSNISKIVGVNTDDAIEALYLDGDYEDNVMIEVSKTAMCDAIITNNKKHFVNKEVVILTPEEYLKVR